MFLNINCCFGEALKKATILLITPAQFPIAGMS